VLVIDDEEDMRDVLAMALSARGLEVETVDGGIAAVTALRGGPFELAITDLRMPGMDGLETLGALKRIDPALVVIVVTGYASQDTASGCLARGAYSYLLKPFDLADLYAVVDRALDAREPRC
jgi:DNA-binding NtrC family response regulator